MLAVQRIEGYVDGMIKIKPFRGFFMASADSHLNHLWFFPKKGICIPIIFISQCEYLNFLCIFAV